MYPYPLTSESVFTLPVPREPELEVRAWELRLRKDAKPDEEPGVFDTYPVPGSPGPGVFALVWDGSATFVSREAGSATDVGEGGVGVAFLERTAEIRRGADVAEARVAVIGVFAKDGEVPDFKLLERGACGIPPMSGGVEEMLLILRRLNFSDATLDPPDLWSRPGYFLSTIGGPTGGHQCGGEGDPTEGELDFVVLPPDQLISLNPGNGTGRASFIIDFYVDGDPVAPRNPETEPGCHIRCWGP